MNTWKNRHDFTKVQGKYDMLIMDYSDKNRDKPDGPVKPEKPVPVSKLDERIQTLITLICNVKAMEEMLKEMKYDTKKAPLGRYLKISEIIFFDKRRASSLLYLYFEKEGKDNILHFNEPVLCITKIRL